MERGLPCLLYIRGDTGEGRGAEEGVSTLIGGN